MTNWIELDPAYSTTRRVRKVAPEVVEAELKAAHKPEDHFETISFLPEGQGRKGDGGLRTKGYFKKSSEEKPLITIITIVYNGEAQLEETILSVINQTYDTVEYIIIDGGSTDRTLDIVRKYEQAIDYWVSEKDDGIYDAMNKGISACKGEVIGILHAGTKLQLKALESINEIIIKGERDSIIAGSVAWHTGDNFFYEFRSKLSLLSSRNTKILHESIYIPRKFYSQVGQYDTRYNISADYEWISRAESISALNVVYTDEVLICYGGGWGLSGLVNNERRKIKEHYNISKKYVGRFFSLRRYAFRFAKFTLKRAISFANRTR